jgi:hypothetical protein
MRVLSSPPALRGKTLLFLLLIPMAALEAVIYARAGWWSLPESPSRIWIAVAALVFGPLVFWLNRGKKWSLHFLVLVLTAWTFVTALWAYRTQNPGLAFFAIALAGFSVTVVSGVRAELVKPFLDGGIRWFQGLPEPMAGIHAALTWEGQQEAVPIRLGRIDEDGAFVFAREPWIPAQPHKKSSVRLLLHAGDSSVDAAVKWISVSEDRRCAGLAFGKLGMEDRVRLGELIGQLRGKGYAD